MFIVVLLLTAPQNRTGPAMRFAPWFRGSSETGEFPLAHQDINERTAVMSHAFLFYGLED